MYRHVKQRQSTVRVRLMLTPEQEALVKAMAQRTPSNPEGDPLTGAELGEGHNKPASSADGD